MEARADERRDPIRSEVTPNYRTLDEPTKLLGLSIGQWGAVALAAGFAYLLLLVSPLPWRVNVSLIVDLRRRADGAASAPRAGRALGLAADRRRLPLAREAGAAARASMPSEPPSGGVVVLDEAPAEIGR